MALGTEACMRGRYGTCVGSGRAEGRKGRGVVWCGERGRSFLASAFRPAPWARLGTRRSAAPPSSIALLSCSVLSCPLSALEVEMPVCMLCDPRAYDTVSAVQQAASERATGHEDNACALGGRGGWWWVAHRQWMSPTRGQIRVYKTVLFARDVCPSVCPSACPCRRPCRHDIAPLSDFTGICQPTISLSTSNAPTAAS